MDEAVKDIEQLYKQAKNVSEFDLVLTLINYKGISSQNLNSNLMEWFDAIPFYAKLYKELEGKEKARMALQLYSTFFENSDFYNMVGSLCRITLGYKGSSYLFWKTRKYERLLGIGEKQDFLMELFVDAEKQGLVDFYEKVHFKEIRNSFFHSAYSIEEDEYVMHDTEPMLVDGVNRSSFDIPSFFYPKVDAVIAVFDTFKKYDWDLWNSYNEDKIIDGYFPNPCRVTIMGSEEGLKGFKIKNSVSFFGKLHDSGIWYDEEYNFWSGHNIRMDMARIEDIEIDDQLKRYENKEDITKNDKDFFNLVDKVKERNNPSEIRRATLLLLKYGDKRMDKMEAEENEYKKKSYPKIILPYYKLALEIGSHIFEDIDYFKSTLQKLESQ